MKRLVSLRNLLQGLSLCCALSITLGACHDRSEALEREPQRALIATATPDAHPPSARQQRFLEDLERSPNPSPQRTALVQRELADARSSATAAMRAWASEAAPLSENAYAFLQNMADVAIAPLAEQPLPQAPKSAAQALWLLSDAETELRRKVLLHLNSLLGDMRELPVESTQAGPPHRVCDEAYVAIRRLVAFPEPEFKQALSDKSFYASSFGARSALIEHLSRVPTWQRILDANGASEDKPTKPSSSPKQPARPQLAPMQ